MQNTHFEGVYSFKHFGVIFTKKNDVFLLLNYILLNK